MASIFMIYPRKEVTSSAYKWFQQCGSKLELDVEIVFRDRLHTLSLGELYFDNIRVPMPDIVVMRHYDTPLAQWFELSGVRVVNSSAAMSLCEDKMLSQIYFQRAGLPVIPTLYLGNSSPTVDIEALRSRFCDAGRFIVKATVGAKGEKVFLVEDDRQLSATLEKCRGGVIVQPLIESSFGRDVRVWVVGDRVVGAVERYNDDSYLSNIAAGGSCRHFEVTPYVERLSIDAARSVGAEIVGVDLLFDGKGGFYLCEINGNAGFRSISSLDSRVDIPLEIMKYMKSLLF